MFSVGLVVTLSMLCPYLLLLARLTHPLPVPLGLDRPGW